MEPVLREQGEEAPVASGYFYLNFKSNFFTLGPLGHWDKLPGEAVGSSWP